jgi:hypothetical protein
MAVGAARTKPAGAAWCFDDRQEYAEVLQAATMALYASGSDAGALGPDDVHALLI